MNNKQLTAIIIWISIASGFAGYQIEGILGFIFGLICFPAIFLLLGD